MTMLWILLFVPVYFVWTAVHELSHFFMAKWLVNASLVKIRLWPHFRDDSEGDGLWRRLRWGSIRWETKLAISHEAFAIISFAPPRPECGGSDRSTVRLSVRTSWSVRLDDCVGGRHRGFVLRLDRVLATFRSSQGSKRVAHVTVDLSLCGMVSRCGVVLSVGHPCIRMTQRKPMTIENFLIYGCAFALFVLVGNDIEQRLRRRARKG